jgi:hypothetical protein
MPRAEAMSISLAWSATGSPAKASDGGPQMTPTSADKFRDPSGD